MSVELLSGAGAVIAAITAWIMGRWVKSGRIASSEASMLWEAAEAMRAELRAEIAAQRKRIEDLEQRYDELRTENEMLLRENLQLRLQLQPPSEAKDQDIARLVRSLRERHGVVGDLRPQALEEGT